MMRLVRIPPRALIVFVLALLATPARALDDWTLQGNVIQLAVTSTGYIIRTNVSGTETSGIFACRSQNTFSLDRSRAQSDEMYATLLAALISKNEVKIYGTDSDCDGDLPLALGVIITRN